MRYRLDFLGISSTIIILYPSLAVYGIVTAELIVCGVSYLRPSREAYLCKLPQVHRNRSYVQAGENSWGFGQVVSILLLLPICIEILDMFKRSASGFTHRKEGPVEGQAEVHAAVHSSVVTAV